MKPMGLARFACLNNLHAPGGTQGVRAPFPLPQHYLKHAAQDRNTLIEQSLTLATPNTD